MRADIAISPSGRGTLTLDGHDISRSTRGFTLTAAVGTITQLEIDLLIFEDSKITGEVDVIIPKATSELLTRLGWTPPTT